METLQINPPNLLLQTQIMNSLTSRIRPTHFLKTHLLRAFSTSRQSSSTSLHCLISTTAPIPSPTKDPVQRKTGSRRSARVGLKEKTEQLKRNWLASLSCPLPEPIDDSGENDDIEGGLISLSAAEDWEWVIGVDPDVSGALSIVRSDESGYSAQVFDSPHLQVMVGKGPRKRLDANSIVQLLNGLNAPFGTTAYVEQSLPFPKDGKQSWWSGGFNYGLWIGVLVASGFSVVPVPSFTWKRKFKIYGSSSPKDDSRRIASTLFPSLSPMLKRKMDHGRADSLLIATYGISLKMDSISNEEETQKVMSSSHPAS